MSRFSSRAFGRSLAFGAVAAAVGLGALSARAQNAGSPFYFPASPNVAAPAAAPQPYAPTPGYPAPATYAAPAYAAPVAPSPATYAAPAPAPRYTATPPQPQTSAASWRATTTTEPSYGAPLYSAQPGAAPVYSAPRPSPAPVYSPTPAPSQAMIAPAQAASAPVYNAPAPMRSDAAPVRAAGPAPAPAPAIPIASGGANVFAPVATVNDKVITRFDVEQRARILAAADETSGVSPGSLLNEALQSLVNDQVKIQAAKSAGIEAKPEAVRAGLAEVAEQNKMSMDSMLAFFRARGVSREAVELQVVAEIVWRDYLRARYSSRIEPSELDISSAMNANPSLSRDQARSRLVSERASLTSRSVLQELRRKAIIDMKTGN